MSRKIPATRRPAGAGSPEVQHSDHARFNESIASQLAAGVDLAEIEADGKSKPGNTNDYLAQVSFKRALTPQFVPHSMGFVAKNWCVVSPQQKGSVWESKPPTKYGVTLMSDTDNFRCRIRIWGQRGNNE